MIFLSPKPQTCHQQFQNSRSGVIFTEDEKNFSLRMMSNWIEFMKTGNITGWEDFRKTELGFYSIKNIERSF